MPLRALFLVIIITLIEQKLSLIFSSKILLICSSSTHFNNQKLLYTLNWSQRCAFASLCSLPTLFNVYEFYNPVNNEPINYLTTLFMESPIGSLPIISTGLPHYNSPHYNTDFSITRSSLGSQMVIFLLFYCKLPHYNTVSLITQSVSVDPKDSVLILSTVT